MASLLIGGGVFIHEKIKDKKEAKREAKRKQYEDRYKELEAEHEKSQRSISGTKAASDTGKVHESELTKSSVQADEKPSSRGVHQINGTDVDDGPGRWVDEANVVRTRSQTTH